MADRPVGTVHLFSDLLASLVDLLRGLADEDWRLSTACPGWSVHDVAGHLLGVEVGNVSVRRDGWRLGPEPGQDPDVWLNRFNAEWVISSRRLSPPVLVSLLESAGTEFIEVVSTLDLEEMGGPVGWATGTAPAPVWLDVAREYMERVVHQQQIREAVSRPLLGGEFAGPAVATAVHAMPIALSRMRRPPGTVVSFIAEGDGGGTWFVVRVDDGWELHEEPPAEPATIVRMSVDGALKLLVRDPAAPQPAITGDGQVGAAIARAKAVLG